MASAYLWALYHLNLRVARGISKSHVQLAKQLACFFMVMANTAAIVHLWAGVKQKQGTRCHACNI